MRMDVLQSLHNLKQYTLHAAHVEAFVISRLHQLVEVTVHVFHTYVELFAERIEEDVEGGYEVLMIWQGPEEDYFTKFRAGCK